MADNGTPGIRGPRGPGSGSGGGSGSGAGRPAASSSRRSSFERASFPLLQWLHGLPRWLVVVTPAILLFVGLVLPRSLGWLGGILLLLTALLLAWLTALSWPRVAFGQRLVRAVIVVALVGLAVLKALGRL